MEIACQAKRVCILQGKIIKKMEQKLEEYKTKLREDYERELQKPSYGRKKRKKGKKGHNHGHGHGHGQCYDHDHDHDVPPGFLKLDLEGVMIKKNFDYYLLDHEDINEYMGKEPTKIHQILRVPFANSLDLAYFLVSQIYPKTEKEKDGDGSLVRMKVNKDLVIEKDDTQQFLVFKWVSGEKNDIIADCLALMFSQMPQDPSSDIFYEESRPGETEELKRMRQKVTKRVVGTFKNAFYEVDGHMLSFNLRNSNKQGVTVNLRSGEIKCPD